MTALDATLVEITARRIRALRKEWSLTQKQVADALACNAMTYLHLERGQHNSSSRAPRVPTVSQLIALASLYHVSVDYLLGRTDVREVAR